MTVLGPSGYGSSKRSSVLAEDIELVSAISHCTWDGLVEFVFALAEHGLKQYIGISGGRWLLAIARIRADFCLSKDGLDLAYILGKTRFFQSTVPHDKVYGLAALLHKEDLDNLVVDYELLVATFYNSLVLYLLAHDAVKRFNCSGTTESATSIDESNQVLVVAGYTLHVIAELRTNNSLLYHLPGPISNSTIRDVDQSSWWPKVKLMKEFAQKSLPYPDNLDLSSVWPRLLVCDQGLIEERVEDPESYF